MKLSKPLVIQRFGGEEKTITEIELKKEQLTAEIIIKAEQRFLNKGMAYPTTGLEETRGYQACVLCELLELRDEEINQMSGEDFLELTNKIKGFFGKSVLEKLQEILSEKQS